MHRGFQPQLRHAPHPNFILDTLRRGEKVGQPQILFRVSNADPAEDYTISYQGLVSDFFGPAWCPRRLTCTTVPAPSGSRTTSLTRSSTRLTAWTAACAPASAPLRSAGVKVALEPCGVSSKTVWIVDSADSTFSGYVPLINGSDTNFSQPFVLTYPGNGYPTDIPRPQLFVTNLTGFSNGTGNNPSGVNDNQLWGFDQGVLP